MRRLILDYVFWCGLVLIAADLLYARSALPMVTPSLQSSLQDKVAWYRQHAKEFDLLFLGDSRTYTGMFYGPFDASR